MARAARWVYGLIFSMLLGREPEARYQEPGFQPPAVVHPDDSHRDPIVTVEDICPQVEQAPPPVRLTPSTGELKIDVNEPIRVTEDRTVQTV